MIHNLSFRTWIFLVFGPTLRLICNLWSVEQFVSEEKKKDKQIKVFSWQGQL